MTQPPPEGNAGNRAPGNEPEPFGEVLAEAKRIYEQFPGVAGLVNCGDNASPVPASTIAEDSVAARLLPGHSKEELVEANRAITAVITHDLVVNNQRHRFVAGQLPADQPTDDSFRELRGYTLAYGNQDLLRADLIMNDDGKRVDVMQEAAVIKGAPVTDHDEALLIMCRRVARLPVEGGVLPDGQEVPPPTQQQLDMVSTFANLDTEGQKTIIERLEARVSLAQLMQGESNVASLAGLRLLMRRPELLHHAILETVYDIAGARGHERQDSALTITEGFFQRLKLLLETFDECGQDAEPVDIYRTYLLKQADRFEIAFDADDPDSVARGIAITRLCLMGGLDTPAQAAEVVDMYHGNLGSSSRSMLRRKLGELNEDDPLVYHAPRLIKNILRAMRDGPEGMSRLRAGMAVGAIALAQMFSIAEGYKRKGEAGSASDEQAMQIVVSGLARQIGAKPGAFERFLLDVTGEEGGFVGSFAPEQHIDLEGVKRLQNIGEAVPGNTFAVVALGGGADSVWGRAVGGLMEGAGKTCAGLVSVRRTIDSATGQERRLIDPLEDMGGGVYVVGSDSRMSSGRYHEDLVAASWDRPTLLVMYDPAEGADRLDAKITRALARLGQLDTVVGVDSNGDSLLPTDTPKARRRDTDGTSQDHEVMGALRRIGSRISVAAVECDAGLGTGDVPPNINQLLRTMGSRYYVPTTQDGAAIIATLDQMGLPEDPPSPERYSRMLPAHVAALQGVTGIIDTSPPESFLYGSGRWFPYMSVNELTSYLFFTNLDDAAAQAARNAS